MIWRTSVNLIFDMMLFSHQVLCQILFINCILEDGCFLDFVFRFNFVCLPDMIG